MDTIISLPVLTVLLASLRLSLSQTLLQRQWFKHLLVDGYHDLGYPLLSQQIVEANSSQHSGNNLSNHWAVSIYTRHPTIRLPMVSLNVVTALLKTHPNAIHWTQSLPLVLLGIRTTIKSDLHCTTAELVYGTTLRLPGEFLVTSNLKTTPDPSTYLTRLKSIMQHTTPAPLRPHPATKSYVSDELLRCTHVFVRHDAIRKPLQYGVPAWKKYCNQT